MAVHPFHDADQKVSLSRTRTALGMFNALVNLAPSEQSWLAITMATWNRPRHWPARPVLHRAKSLSDSFAAEHTHVASRRTCYARLHFAHNQSECGKAVPIPSRSPEPGIVHDTALPHGLQPHHDRPLLPLPPVLFCSFLMMDGGGDGESQGRRPCLCKQASKRGTFFPSAKHAGHLGG